MEPWIITLEAWNIVARYELVLYILTMINNNNNNNDLEVIAVKDAATRKWKQARDLSAHRRMRRLNSLTSSDEDYSSDEMDLDDCALSSADEELDEDIGMTFRR